MEKMDNLACWTENAYHLAVAARGSFNIGKCIELNLLHLMKRGRNSVTPRPWKRPGEKKRRDKKQAQKERKGEDFQSFEDINADALLIKDEEPDSDIFKKEEPDSDSIKKEQYMKMEEES